MLAFDEHRRPWRRIDPDAIPPGPIVTILDFSEFPQGFHDIFDIPEYSVNIRGINPSDAK